MRARVPLRYAASVLALATLNLASAQDQTAWQRTFGTGEDAERPLALRIDTQGNVIVGGSFASLATAYDFLVLEYDGAGNLQWSRTFDESGENDYFGDVQVDAGGDVYVTGESSLLQVGQVANPGVRTYQVWHRNSAAFCTAATANLTNGVRVVWVP